MKPQKRRIADAGRRIVHLVIVEVFHARGGACLRASLRRPGRRAPRRGPSGTCAQICFAGQQQAAGVCIDGRHVSLLKEVHVAAVQTEEVMLLEEGDGVGVRGRSLVIT